jgi:hypothetical protein
MPQGAKSLAAYLEDRFPYQSSMGICNCRPVRGGTTRSHHSECRAYDCGIPTDNGKYIPTFGDPIHELLGPHGKRLGLDHLILNRRIYSATSPDGRTYKGVHPHYNHAHIGLNTRAGQTLNYATLVAVLGDPSGETNMLPLNKGDVSEDIRLAKDRMNETYGLHLDLEGSNPDGATYDDALKAAVIAHLAKYTGDKSGDRINANMWNGLLKDFTIHYSPPSGGVSEARVKELIAATKLTP